MRFVDSSFWIALQARRDQRHSEARLLWARETDSLLTTTPILAETWTFLRRRLGHPQAWDFVDAVHGSPRVTIYRVDQPTEDEAWAWLRRHDERRYSFVDATSFAVMRRLRLREALAFDDDFSAAGFVEVRP